VYEIIDNTISGFNSWGSKEPMPQIPFGRNDLRVFQIHVKEVIEQDVTTEENDRCNYVTKWSDDNEATWEKFSNLE